jgi:predicted glycoside hydrolase/deacetylase ChbG (UPF0249 family)
MGRSRVVLNADDFGLHPAVNRAVARAHDRGALTSASLLANGPAFEDAVALARARPALGVGVHLNLLRGRPLLEPARLRSLVGQDGRFLGSPRALFLRGLAGRLSRREMLDECLAQVERVRAAGLAPTHLDCEKHAHHWVAGLASVVLEVARRSGIASVRVVRERLRLQDARKAPRKALFSAFLTARGRALAGEARRAHVRVARAVFGVTLTGRLTADDVLGAVERAPRGGLLEVFLHPGEPEPGDPPLEGMGRFTIIDGWKGEARALAEAAPALDRTRLARFQ